jgi:TonB family protein
MTMMKCVVAILCCVAFACGGKKAPDTTPTHTGDGDHDTTPKHQNQSATMVSTEQMDEINRMFERKGKSVSRCLAIVVDNKELPKNSRGKITLEVTISPSGKVGSVKILKASLESKPLHDCVIERVKEIEFPKLPKDYPTTYTYAFEAM